MATKKQILNTLGLLGYSRQAQYIINNWESIRRTLRSSTNPARSRSVAECLIQGFVWNTRELTWAEVYNTVHEYERIEASRNQL